MGGAPAIRLCSPASGRRVAACFTESAFASTRQLLVEGTNFDFPSSWMLDVEFDSESRIATVMIPVMIMHGTEDWRVGFHNAEILWQAVRDNNPQSRFHVFEDTGHRNIPYPSYTGVALPTEYSHPDELPADLAADFEVYKGLIVDFVVDALAE